MPWQMRMRLLLQLGAGSICQCRRRGSGLAYWGGKAVHSLGTKHKGNPRALPSSEPFRNV